MHSLINLLKKNYPLFHFQAGEAFQWSPDSVTIFYGREEDPVALLHELAHAILGHRYYSRDVELLEMEREAWEYARDRLSKEYVIVIEDDIVEQALDTYRDWLHARSNCTTCSSTGIQISPNIYKCVACGTSWRVNEARLCALRRYTLTT